MCVYILHMFLHLLLFQIRDGLGLYLGGWDAARPRVADSSLSASRFKFYLGGTAWGPGQLADEISSGTFILYAYK